MRAEHVKEGLGILSSICCMIGAAGEMIVFQSSPGFLPGIDHFALAMLLFYAAGAQLQTKGEA